MERALRGAHGIGYEVYKRKHRVRMAVERKREVEYIHSRRVVADIDRKFHHHI